MAERRMGIEKVKMPLKHAILSDNQTLKKKKSLPDLSKTLVNVQISRDIYLALFGSVFIDFMPEIIVSYSHSA